MNQPEPVEIPDKATFKPTEVCDLVQIPAYVLRTWENEFKDLGTAKTPGAARTYRRRDVELALRIKELVFTEHLTLAGVRRRLEQEHLLVPAAPEPEPVEADTRPFVTGPVKATLDAVKGELRELLQRLGSGARSNVGPAPPPADAAAQQPVGEPSRDAQPEADREGEPHAPSLPGFDGGVAGSGGAESAEPKERGRAGGRRSGRRR